MRVKAVPLAVAVESCVEAVRKLGGDMRQCTIRLVVEAPAPDTEKTCVASAMLTLEQIERSRE